MELCCYPQKKTLRVFDIEAISIPIVYNKYGDHDPNGLLYVLKKDAKRIKEKALKNFYQEIPQPCEEVKPLVIRANLGDEIEIRFSHSLDRDLSIHVQGLAYNVKDSDGTSVGYNPDTTTRKSIVYRWSAFREYAVFFHDELEILNKDGETPIDPHTMLPSSTTGISYRSEPMRNRDPAPPILRAYVGDPSKIRLARSTGPLFRSEGRTGTIWRT